MKEIIFSPLLGFEPWSPGTESQCAPNELRWGAPTDNKEVNLQQLIFRWSLFNYLSASRILLFGIVGYRSSVEYNTITIAIQSTHFYALPSTH